MGNGDERDADGAGSTRRGAQPPHSVDKVLAFYPAPYVNELEARRSFNVQPRAEVG